MEQSKTCHQCNQIYSLTDFHRDSTRKSGYRDKCKKCVKKDSAFYYDTNKELRLAQVKANAILNAEKRRAYQKQYVLKNRQKLRESAVKRRLNNLAATRAKSREYRKANLEKVRINEANYYARNKEKVIYKQHKRRSLKKGNASYLITAKDLRRLKNSPCFACGSKTNLTMDHIIPIAKGGSHGIGNLMTLCRGCNGQKSARTWMEYRLWLLHSVSP